MWITFMVAALMVSEPSFANGFVTVVQDPYPSKQSQRQICNPMPECSSHFDFALHATSKRYGSEVRKDKREFNRKKRRERAERADKDDDEGDDDSSSNSEKRLVAVFKWPFRRIRKVLRS